MKTTKLVAQWGLDKREGLQEGALGFLNRPIAQDLPFIKPPLFKALQITRPIPTIHGRALMTSFAIETVFGVFDVE